MTARIIGSLLMVVSIALTRQAAAQAETAKVSADEFNGILKRCAQCHQPQFKNVDTAVRAGLVKPGNPDKSALCAKIKGLHMSVATGLSDADARAASEFIGNLKDSDVKPAAPGEKPLSGMRPTVTWARKMSTEPAPVLPKIAPDPFKTSFSRLSVPTGAMTGDPEETLLRYQACDLIQQIAFLEAMAKLDLSKEQAAKLLPYARKARDRVEERAEQLRDQWTAYAAQCNWTRKFMVTSMFRCDEKTRNELIGRSAVCGCPAYTIGNHDRTEEFYEEIAAIAREAAAVFSEAQKGKMLEVLADQYWVELPVHTRCAVIKAGPTRTRMDGVGRLMVAPNAVAWLEKKTGEDTAASIKRAAEFLPLGASIIQKQRDMLHYDLRLVDGIGVIGGMNFTMKQLDSLIGVLTGEMKSIHADHAKAVKENLRPLVTLLTEMRDDVEQGKGLVEEKKQKAIQLQEGICRGNYRHKMGVGRYEHIQGSLLCPVHKDYTLRMEAVLKRLEGDILAEGQCKLIYDTHSCQWYPPAHLSNPVRVGQVPTPIDYPELKVIAELRAAADSEYEKKRDAFAAETVKKLVGEKASQEAREKEQRRVTDLLDRIRSIPDADYVMDKHSFLSQILKKNCPEFTGDNFKPVTEEDVKDLTWDKFVKAGTIGETWSPWDLKKAMEKAGKPLPSVTEKLVPYSWVEWSLFLREMPMYFLMDPDVIPSLEIMRTIGLNPAKYGKKDMETLPQKAETPENYLDEPVKKP